MRKAILSVFLACVLILAGCSSTVPSLKDIVLQNTIPESSEGRQVIKLSLDYAFDELEDYDEYKEYIDLALNVLESGIAVDYKQIGQTELYYKLSFVDPEPIKQLPFWNSDVDPSVEFILKEDGNIYFTLSSEDYWITESIPEYELDYMQEENELAENIMNVVLAEITKFVTQFEFDQFAIEDHGALKYETPVGEVDVKHISLEITLDNAIAFVATLLDSLANYEGLEDGIRNIMEVVFEADVALGYITEEEINELIEEELPFAIEELQSFNEEFQPLLAGLNADLIAALLGVQLDFNIKTDLYVTKEALVVGSVTTFNVYAEDLDTEQYIDLTLTIENDVWNVNGDVKIDAPENAVTADEFMELAMAGALGEQSVVAPYFTFSRAGELTIGSEYFLLTEVNPILGDWTDTILLDAPPYVTPGGHTMVPVSSINDIAGTVAEWNNETKEATFAVGDREVVVQSGSNIAYVNGVAIEMPESVVIVNNRTFVPLRFVSENLGATVEWNAQLKTIYISF